MLSDEKHYLVESRLLPVARRNGLFNLTGLVSRAPGAWRRTADRRSGRGHGDQQSFFFRDKMPFEHFRDTIMPTLLTLRAASRRIRIWRRRRHGAGALFTRHRAEGNGQGPSRLEDRDHRDRSLQRGA